MAITGITFTPDHVHLGTHGDTEDVTVTAETDGQGGTELSGEIIIHVTDAAGTAYQAEVPVTLPPIGGEPGVTFDPEAENPDGLTVNVELVTVNADGLSAVYRITRL